MANGSIINSLIKWNGIICINRVRAQGEFKVFDSGGGWGFLLGKPILQAFEVVHDYKMDVITISDGKNSSEIVNQIAHPITLHQTSSEVSLTLDIKQRETLWGGAT